MSDLEQRILAQLQKGLPLVPEPYSAIANEINCQPSDVINFIKSQQTAGIFSRFGFIVNHRTLGYRHNAMVVWDIPDHKVDDIAESIAKYACVNLCYRRPRVPPAWPYNLFCMIHAKSRDYVYDNLIRIKNELNIIDYPSTVLFGEKAYKQKGAKYV